MVHRFLWQNQIDIEIQIDVFSKLKSTSIRRIVSRIYVSRWVQNYFKKRTTASRPVYEEILLRFVNIYEKYTSIGKKTVLQQSMHKQK